MEGKTYEICIAKVLYSLEKQEKYSRYEHLKSPIEMMKMELKFLHMFICGLGYLEELDNDSHLRFAIDTLMAKLSQIAEEFTADCRSGGGEDQWLDLEAVMYDLERKCDENLIRTQALGICIHLLGATFKCTSTPTNPNKFGEYLRDTASFTDLILHNLRALQTLDDQMAPAMKQQIARIQRRLEESCMFVDPPSRLFDLIPLARAWLNRISCHMYLYWIDGNDESLAFAMETMLLKTMSCTTSGMISLYIQPTIIPQLLSRHLDFLLGDLDLHMKGGIEILQEGLIFMLSFIVDPHDVDSEDREMTWAQIYATIKKFPSLIYSIRSDEMKEEICKANFSQFVMMVDGVKARVRELFVVIPYSSQFTSPSTNAIGFLTNLIENLKMMLEREVSCIPGFKHSCELLLNELVSFRPLLKTIAELLQDDDQHKELKDLWREAINSIYNADYFTKLYLVERCITWYAIIGLSYIIEHTKFMQIQINKLVGDDKMYTKKRVGNHNQIEGSATSESEQVSVGFIEDERVIIDELTRGLQSLTFVSISGSGGQGKTTLAKRIYDCPNVQCRFQKTVWCYVSKDCPVKELLVRILSCDTTEGGGVLDKKSMKLNSLGRVLEKLMKLEIHDLIERLWKSLRKKRYLIVLDDIWDKDVWDQLESSFPDDKNGSRILLTSRNHDLASQVKSNSISHPLPLFSDEESWELIKKRVFNRNDCDKKLVEIGKKIASCCTGLPLAVALIAGVLGRTKHNLDSWEKVEKNLKTHLAQEGCGNVLELSYKYLPDHLKSCFLYFAAFKRGEEVSAAILKLLWIGEGFVIQDGGTKSSKEDLATKYLKDLVSQGLAVVTEWSSMGGIKKCILHDLLYDLCLEKTKEDNFLHWGEKTCLKFWNDESSMDSSSILLKYNPTRLRFGESDHFIKSSHIVARRELPTSPLHSFLCSTSYYSGRESSCRYLVNFKILTVLKLKLNMCQFPEVILSCVSLRYLELHTIAIPTTIAIIAIPTTIANLWSLITLIFSCYGYATAMLPLSTWDMASLRHVDIDDADLDLEGFDMKSYSKSNIETLGNICLPEDDSRTIEFLRRFPNLRKLKCATRSEKCYIFKLLSMVGSLLIQLESMKFTQDGYFEEHPKSMFGDFAKVESLTELSLCATEIPWNVLSEIGKQLPNLLVLKLVHMACKGRSWKLEDGDFSNLIYLKLGDSLIEEFDISSCDDPLPCLEHLVLKYCVELVEIPPVLGIINTLKTIRVTDGSKELEISAMKILEEQREFGNNTLQVIFQRS